MFGILRGGVAVCVDVDFSGGKGLMSAIPKMLIHLVMNQEP